MIRTESEYQNTLAKILRSDQLLREQETNLACEGLKPAQIKRALEPSRAFRDQLRDEITSYERLKKGQFDELQNLDGIGQMLIGVRIALGLSQRELAEKLGVHESQVSRDERHEYFGVTVERVSKILETLGVVVTTRVEKLPTMAVSA